MMRVNWNYYTKQGRAEGITQLNHCITAYGTKADCKEVLDELPKYLDYKILPSKTKPKLYCLHAICIL